MATFSQLPREIQQAILDHLVVDKGYLTQTDRKNLLAPMRVNSFWFNHTSDILWNNLSNLESTFAQMGFDDDRRQLYVNKIRILNLHTARIYFDLIEHLKFQSLTCLKLRGDHMGILPFLQPNLKTLHFHSSFALTRHELRQLAVSCPNLRELQILPLAASNSRTLIVKPNSDPIDPGTFSAFFGSCKNLKSLTLGKKLPSFLIPAALTGLHPLSAAQLEEIVLSNIEPEALSQESCKILESCTSLRKFEIRDNYTGSPVPVAMVLKHLTTMASLQHLRLDHDLVGDVVENCIRGHSAPFRNLQSLAVKGDMLSISSFLSLSMQSLTRLQLVVEDHAHHICPSLARLQNLTYLNLVIGIKHHDSFTDGARFKPQPHDWQAISEDMQALSTLSKLRSISIRPMNINLTAPWMTDGYFSTWTNRFPNLRDLELDIECFSESYIRDFIIRKFIKNPSTVGMKPLQLEAGEEDPWRRSDLGPDQPRVTQVHAQAADL
ncbi:unnamed protein product [Aureobasidium mustum]|uniref:Uncharacterized protein n=1 Tax=Aureobasidium mustum TaxID=2773714 RepID=A0A9N8K5M8_9PEZI|nr:unnamed protein product [Aureobasidium mustum]